MSIASQSTHQKLPFSYETVFDGLLRAIPNAGMSVKSKDKLIGRITASAGMSLFSWGENLTITVEKIDENTTVIGIESALKVGINIAGTHRHQQNFEKIISILSQNLQNPQQNPDSATGVKRSMIEKILLPIGVLFFPYIFAWFLLRKGYSLFVRLLGFGWLAFMVFHFWSPFNTSSTSSTTSQTSTSAALNTKTVAPPSGEWKYSEGSKDKMTGDVTEYAELDSTTELNFEFPYNGGSKPSLSILRTKGKKDNSILLEVTKGQFLCTLGCSVAVKFDDDKIQVFRAYSPTDGTTTMIYMRNENKFIDRLKQSKHLIISADFFRYAGQQMEFSTTGFKW